MKGELGKKIHQQNRSSCDAWSWLPGTVKGAGVRRGNVRILQAPDWIGQRGQKGPGVQVLRSIKRKALASGAKRELLIVGEYPIGGLGNAGKILCDIDQGSSSGS